MTTLAWTDLVVLFGNLVVLSLVTNGSALAALPDMRRLMVADMGLLSDGQFNASVAIAHAAPGPNVLFVAVAGYQAAGLAGATVMLLGMLLPSVTLSYAAAHWGSARRDNRTMRAFRASTAPIVIALPLASGWGLALQTPAWGYLAVAGVTALLVWRTRVHILALIAAGGAVGALGLL